MKTSFTLPLDGIKKQGEMKDIPQLNIKILRLAFEINFFFVHKEIKE